ncbi:MAG: efflux RND transporter permease subunit, partial [bacterium]|nr:efflux RND transporter permease subunit [bacterium]
MKIASFSVQRPVTLIMATISLVVLGWISVTRIPLESFPSISSSSVRVGVNYASASPEELEREIPLPLEQSLAMLGSVERISSRSGGNSANVSIEFVAGTDMDLAVMEVRDRVDQARVLLPADVERISLFRWQSDDRPILEADLAWKGDEGRLFDIVRKVVEPRLLRLDGVANVNIGGIQEKQLIIELDQQRLEAHDVSLGQLANQLRANNINVSLGRVLDAGLRYQARVRGEFSYVEDIGALPVLGRNLTLADLGTVKYEYPEQERFERLNGRNAVEVQVFKASTANTVDVAQLARAELESISAEYGLLDIRITRDRAEQVLGELNIDSGLLGGLLAVGIIFLFLRSIRSTIVIALAIPVSVCCVFTGIFVAREVFGSLITLNMVSMMGLMLAVGMLVDPAVVTLESIFRRRQEEGEGPVDAAIRGTGEVGMAVVASSLTTMCVFIPFFFLSNGRVSRWMGDAGLTICLAVGVSTIVSLAIIPLASSRLFRSSLDRFDGLLKLLVATGVVFGVGWKVHDIGLAGMVAWGRTTGARVLQATLDMDLGVAIALVGFALCVVGLIWHFHEKGMRSSYVSLLTWTLDHRAVTVSGAVGLMGLGIWLFTTIEQQGTPWQQERSVDLTVEMERSFSLEEVDGLFKEIEADLLRHAADIDLESLSTRIYRGGGTVRARLVDADQGQLTTMQASGAIRRRMPERVGVAYKMGRSRGWAGPELGVEVQLKGMDAAVLEVLAEDVKVQMARIPGVLSVDTSLEDGEEEIRVSVDREQALAYGLSAQDVATTISSALGERRSSSFKAPEREIGIVLQLEEADRVNLEQLKNTSFEARDDTRVQLAALASFQYAKGPQNLQREDRQQIL